jgi:hypothetical protein
MDYNHITLFLNKFKNIIFKDELHRQTISEAIAKHTSYSVDVRTIKTKGTVIYISSSPLLQSEILIHKSKILSSLSESIPDRRFVDIR